MDHLTGFFGQGKRSSEGLIQGIKNSTDSLIITCSNDQSIRVWNSDLSPANTFENMHASFIYSFGIVHDFPSIKQAHQNNINKKIKDVNQLR